MTKEEWKKVEDWWDTGFSSVKLMVDRHEIQLHNIIDKKKMTVSVEIYVDGYIKGEYSNKDSEIGNHFWQRIKKALYSTKELKERAKIWGKRHEAAQQSYFEYNLPYWRSFNAFKKHLTQNNTDIKLISCGWEKNRTNDEPGN